MPPPLKIRSPQWVVSWQHLYDQIELKSLSIEASRCAATDTITPELYKVCIKHIEGHAVLRSREQWRMLSGLSIRQNPLCSATDGAQEISAGLLRSFVAVHKSLAGTLRSFAALQHFGQRSEVMRTPIRATPKSDPLRTWPLTARSATAAVAAVSWGRANNHPVTRRKRAN